MPKIKPQIALQKINEYLGEIDKLLRLDYNTGKDQKQTLNHKIRSLITNAFHDSEQKLKDYDNNVNWFIAIVGEERTEQEKQNDYLSRLRDMKSLLESYKEELQMLSGGSIETETNSKTLANKVFIIHGHDAVALEQLQKTLKGIWNLETIILKDEPGTGRTLIEKFEEEAKRTSYAFAIITPDDTIRIPDTEYFQARPNVIFELGWFYGNLGRNKVCILFKKGTTMHSDLDGISRIEFSIQSVKK